MSLVRSSALSPVVTGGLLYILTRGPASLQQPLLNALGSEKNVERAKTALKWLVALGGIQHLNNYLSNLALNNWEGSGSKAKWNWKKEIAVVTGGANGIGAGIVKALSAKGVMCVVLDVEELPKDMQNYANIRYYHCDITDAAAVTEVAERINSRHGAPTLLFNNAGIAEPHTILNTPAGHVERLFAVNVVAHWHTLQAFLPAMVAANKGHVVATASLSSFVTPAGLVDYAATKAALVALHEGLQAELKHKYHAPGVKTSIVHPTYVRTRMMRGNADELKRNGGILVEPEDVVKAVMKQVLSGRGGRVIVPERLGVARLIRGMPSWMQEGIRDRISKHTRGGEEGFPTS